MMQEIPHSQSLPSAVPQEIQVIIPESTTRLDVGGDPMQTQTPTENMRTKSGISIQLPVTRILYLLSLTIGIIGTYFSLRSHTKETDMPSRVLYSMTLMLAGMLLDAVEVSEPFKQQSTPSPAQKQATSNCQSQMKPEKQSPDAAVMEDKAALSSSYSSGYNLSERISTPPSLVVDDGLELVDLRLLTETKDTDIKFSSTRQLPKPSYPLIRLQHASRTGLHLFSATWFCQSFALFVRNAIQESTSSFLLPYTTLIGLATGHLFRGSIKPWRLWGIRDWIQNNRNTLSGSEAIIFVLLPPIINQNLSYYYYTTSAFWGGYNLNELTFGVMERLLGRRVQNVNVDDNLASEEERLHTSASHGVSDLLTTISGGVLVSASMLLLHLTPADEAGFRNIFALTLGSIGCYAFTYPLGLYLGHKIPRRHYENSLVASTCLLIPLAAPHLSILHYAGMGGAGICGGISHHIVTNRYKNHLAVMQHQLDKVQQIMTTCPGLLQQLLGLPLPADGILLEYRKKQLPFKWIIRSLMAIMVISSLATQSLWKNYPSTLPPIICGIITVYLVNSTLPKYNPSIYDCHEMSRLSRLAYTNSFTQAYITKTMGFICLKTLYDANGELLLLRKSKTANIIFAVNLFNMVYWLFSVKVGYKKFKGGYIPYFPSSQKIRKLKMLTEQDSFDHHLRATSKDQPLTLNYHLLQFMKKNIQPAIESVVNDRIAPSNGANVCPHPLQRLSLFALPRNPTMITPPVADRLASFPLAMLHCQECKEDVRSIHTDFSPDDQRYTEDRFDTSFEYLTGDAIVRGSALALQFQFGLPAGLSLTEDISRFSI